MAQLQTTPLRTEPISQGSPYLDWEPRSSSLAPNRVGLCCCPTDLGNRRLPQEWGSYPHVISLLGPSTLPHLSLSFLTSQISSVSLWGDTHFSEAQTLGPRPQGLLVERGRPFRASAQRFRSGCWAAALLGSLSGSGGVRACPPAQRQVGARALGGRGAGRGSARTSLQVAGPDPSQRVAAGAPVCAHRHPPPSCSG